ncbi:MAG TPA: citrate synthase [Cellvibrio sp.]
MQEPKHDQVRSRNEPFVAKTSTRIWQETPSIDNPYIAREASCYGYDLLELMSKRSFADVFYLLFRGELPTPDEAQLFEALMIGLINPGPRHPATRAAMNVGVGKTNPLHILPIASAVLGGDYLGGGELENAMRFLRKHQASSIPELVMPWTNAGASPENLAGHGIYGFGQKYGGVDLLTRSIAEQLLALPGAGNCLRFGQQLAEALNPYGIGWSSTGVAAAVFADLGFHPRAGGCLFQLLGAPGLVAHGLELANKPITAMPFVSDDNYVIER